MDGPAGQGGAVGRPRRRRGVRLTRLLGLVAVVALVLRGCVVPDARWTVRVVNLGRAPLREVRLTQGDRVLMHVRAIPPGRSAEVRFRNPTRGSGMLRYRRGTATTGISTSFAVGTRWGPIRIEREYRIGDGGLAGSSLSYRPDPFGCGG